MESNFRPLEASERELLQGLLVQEFPGREELRRQLNTVLAKRIDADGSIALQTGAADPAPVKSRVPTEGQCPDADGTVIHVLLHVVNGFMNELEIFKEDSSRVIQPPVAGNLVLFAPYSGEGKVG